MKKYIELDSGTHFYYDEIKGNSDNVVLFIHGSYQTSFAFSKLVKNLENYSSDTTYISINLTGFGKSFNSSYQNFDLMELSLWDIDNFFKKYNEENRNLKWKIVAYSFGCYILMRWLDCMNKDECDNLPIDSIVLASPFGFFYHLSSYGYFWYYFFKYNIYGNYIYLVNKFMKYQNYIIEDSNFSSHLIGDSVCNSTPTETYVKKPILHVLNKITIPIYLIYGEKDSLIPFEQGNILQMLFPQIIKGNFIIKNTGHVFIYTADFEMYLKKILFSHKNENTQISLKEIIYSHPNIWYMEKKIDEYYKYILENTL